jgi:hypothetical protein
MFSNLSFCGSHINQVSLKIYSLNPHAYTFHEPEPTPVKQFHHKQLCSTDIAEHFFDFVFGYAHRRMPLELMKFDITAYPVTDSLFGAHIVMIISQTCHT